MSYWHDDSHDRRDIVKIPTIWVWIALSILIHIAVMWQWRSPIRPLSMENAERGDVNNPLTVQLMPPPASKPTPPAALQPESQPRRTPRPRPIPPQAAPRPPVLAQPAPAIPQPTPAPEPKIATPAPLQRQPQVAEDFASMLEKRRRERGESIAAAPQAPVEDENARANRIAAANLNPQRQRAFGYDPARGGGVFEVTSISYDYADFKFFGWNRDVRRNTQQLIEVRKGNNPTIQLAVVRKMIEIIRTYEQEDFQWESYRLNRTLRLSARARDSAGLEDFLMQEFFSSPRQALP